jgi:hypothetical protein
MWEEYQKRPSKPRSVLRSFRDPSAPMTTYDLFKAKVLADVDSNSASFEDDTKE